MQKNSLGLEYYRRFSSAYGDFLTFDLQFRLGVSKKNSGKFELEPEFHNL